ncbi:protein of unknown function [Micropruina glycogenica]|uniref:Uncharacterized protein n=1 Tax=Micropruina glycogenica TaxID=75385 RepID=A0A2N9JL24_9ACTN|nr:protein of unknown function [Micropruina glycogenica]
MIRGSSADFVRCTLPTVLPTRYRVRRLNDVEWSIEGAFPSIHRVDCSRTSGANGCG